jgi:hypothetical protein
MALRTDVWKIDQGADFNRVYTCTDPDTGVVINLTGWTAKAQIRSFKLAATVLHEMTSAAGTILLGSDGKVTFKIPGATSAAWTWIAAEAVKDCLLTGPTGQLIRLVDGEVQVSPSTTR